MYISAVPLPSSHPSFGKRSSNIMDLSCLISDQTPLSPRSTFSFSPRNGSSSSSSSISSNASSYFAPSVPTSPFRFVQPPPSPPVEDYRPCSLPSISSLLQSTGDAPLHASKRQRPNPPSLHKIPVEKDDDKLLLRGQLQNQKIHDSMVVNGRPVHLPLTPPLVPDTPFRRQSLSSVSHRSTSEVMNRSPDMLPVQQQQQPQQQISNQSSTTTRPIQHPSHPSQPSPYASPVESSAPIYFYQEKQSHQPQLHPSPNHQVQTTNKNPQGLPANPVSSPPPTWQHHHHYFPPSGTTPHPQPQDRYVCRVCNKAFSRPSSLRIHSHSHTGEKPFQCAHVGCGKCFSVRSNMKRHERGCHPRRQAAALT